MVQLKKFSIREEVMVEYNGYWYPAVIIEVGGDVAFRELTKVVPERDRM